MKNPMTTEEAVGMICPFRYGSANYPASECFCRGKLCMAWEVVEERFVREDHSGGRELMNNLMLKRPGTRLERAGPPGSEGLFILPERGRCGRL